MARTPEGVVKSMVRDVCKMYGEELDLFAPVQSGLGRQALDFIGCINGYHFEVETKAPGKKPTPLQEITISKKIKAGARVFVIDGQAGCDELQLWLDAVRRA